ncbi:MAG: hypothetical protein ACQEP5_06125 [Actinomycetota bacterium]
MCCAITSFIIFGPRIGLIVWWLVDPLLFRSAFSTWIIPLIFALFAPFTMIFYMVSWYLGPGISGFEWLLIILGILLDISSYGGGYSSRQRYRGI